MNLLKLPWSRLAGIAKTELIYASEMDRHLRNRIEAVHVPRHMSADALADVRRLLINRVLKESRVKVREFQVFVWVGSCCFIISFVLLNWLSIVLFSSLGSHHHHIYF